MRKLRWEVLFFVPSSVLCPIPIPLFWSLSLEALSMPPFVKAFLTLGIFKSDVCLEPVFSLPCMQSWEGGPSRWGFTCSEERHPTEMSRGVVWRWHYCRELVETTHPPFICIKWSRGNPSIGCLNIRGQGGIVTYFRPSFVCCLHTPRTTLKIEKSHDLICSSPSWL